jgi:hypothetical protein
MGEDMRAICVALLISTVTLGGCSSNSRLVGSYIDTDYGDGVMMVQIDRVDDRNVRGTVSLATFGSNGVVQSSRLPISGTIDDKALNLSVENGAASSMFNGTTTPDGLDLTLLSNGGAVRYVFKRKDAAEFNKTVESLRARMVQSQQDILKVQSAARSVELQGQIDSQADQLLSDAASISAAVRKADGSGAYYQSIAARNARLRAYEAGLGRNDISGRGPQAESDMSGNNASALGSHTRAMLYWQNVQSTSERELKRASQLITDCQTDNRLHCARLASAAAQMTSSVEQFRSAMGRENAAYEAQQSRE